MATVLDPFPGTMTPDLEGPIIATGEEPMELSPVDKLMALAGKTGDFSEAISLNDLATLGSKVVEEYERDKADRDEWEKTAKEALDLAAQRHKDPDKTFPWKGASNTRFPLLTTAALQFNARTYPSIVKGDEAVSCKVIGKDRGRPMMGPDGQPVMGINGQALPPEMLAGLPPEAQAQVQPIWQIPPGGKAARAQRVAEYMNTTIFYRMKDWEGDTDTLTMQLPIVGCAFRKVWYDSDRGEQRAALVPALRILAPKGARSCETTPRLTEEIPDVYPYEINQRMRSGFYREVELVAEGDDEDNARLLLEQHRMMDLDDDGLEEPYIVTVDKATSRVLRIEANFGPDKIKTDDSGRVLSVERGRYYIKYDFFPDPDGGFYGLGLGHLLKLLGEVVDTAINQMIDTGTAAAAGGGFIGSGVRLQARGGGSTVRFAPGEYKTVDVSGDQLRNAIVERTLPQVSPVTFQVLDLILGAAQEIAGAKDVLTGDASNTGQVGTTLALIEQGLQVFNAIYKRIYRALKDEFSLLFENIGKFGGEAAAKDYMEVLDDPAANFEQDFNSKDLDIRPVSDPGSVTRMQKLSKAQFLLSTIDQVVASGGNPQEIMQRVFEAADVEDIEKIFPPPQPQQPDPIVMARADKDASTAELNRAKAEEIALNPQIEASRQQLQAAETQGEQQIKRAQVEIEAFRTGLEAGQVGTA